jgi:hypothetical protein
MGSEVGAAGAGEGSSVVALGFWARGFASLEVEEGRVYFVVILV